MSLAEVRASGRIRELLPRQDPSQDLGHQKDEVLAPPLSHPTSCSSQYTFLKEKEQAGTPVSRDEGSLCDLNMKEISVYASAPVPEALPSVPVSSPSCTQW